jgi:sarcosine oxidase
MAADVVVVGAGIVGLAAADALVQRGAEVVVLERGEPGAGQSYGEARGFRHLHATRQQIWRALRARAAWDEWSARAGEPLVGGEGALRLGGDVEADAAELRAVGVPAALLEGHAAVGAGPLLWDPRGGAIRARRAVEWLAGGLRIRRAEVTAVAPGRVETAAGPLDCGRVVVCAGAGTERLWPGVAMRRVVHLRVTFEAPGAPLPTWADRSGRFGEVAYGVADGPGRFALGLADVDSQPAAPPGAEAVPDGVELGEVRTRVHAYARAAFPRLGEPAGEVVRLLTILPGGDEDAFVVHDEPGLTVVAGHNLFKLAPVLGEEVARAANASN